MKSFSDYTISLSNIKQNLLAYKKIDSKSKICAVVKANAYGIGLKNVVPTIDKFVDYYAVACFIEAKKLRLLTTKPILILNFTPTKNIAFCQKNNISISVSNLVQVNLIAQNTSSNLPKIKLHLAINSGMNRIGFDNHAEFKQTIKAILSSKNMQIDGIFTHLYNAKNKIDCKQQISIFMQYLAILKKYIDVSKIIKHTSSSLPATNFKNFRFDMVRLGIMLFASIKNNAKIKTLDAINIKSKIINVYKLQPGQSVGYNKGFVAKKPLTIGTVPLGYADGIMRVISKKGYVLCCGRPCKILGNICMDMFMIDLTNTNAKLFDTVTIVGRDKKHTISLNRIAKFCNTIDYEILTNIKQNRFNIKIE